VQNNLNKGRFMNKLIEFCKESWVEVTTNVTWPKLTDLQSSSVLVLIASLIFAILVGLVDLVFKSGLNLFYSSI
jgi:preprotein translocase subunit SecE